MYNLYMAAWVCGLHIQYGLETLLIKSPCMSDSNLDLRFKHIFYILNITEHEISTAQNNKNAGKYNFSCYKTLRWCIYHADKC